MVWRSFYFLRHGETEANAKGILQGHLDTVLNEVGRQQALVARSILQAEPIDYIVSSTLQRAFETAEIVNSVINKPVDREPGIMERGFGVFQGLDSDQIAAWKNQNGHLLGQPESYNNMPVPPGGETYEVFRERIITSMTRHLADKKGAVLFVSHGGVYRVLCREFDLEVNQSPNAQPFYFECDNGAWRLNILK